MTTAQDKANYAITEVGGSSVTVNLAEVKEDGKTVILTTDILDDNKDHSLVISGLKFANDDTKTQNFVKGFTAVKDTAAPEIVSATSVTGTTGTNKVEIVMNEAVDIAGTKTPVFKVNGTVVAASQSATDAKKFTLTLPSNVQAGTSLAIEATNLFDLAGNKGTAAKTISVASDLTAPKVTAVETISDSKVKVTFDKAISDANFNTTFVSVTANGMPNAYANTKTLSADKKSVTLDLTAGTLYTDTIKSRNLTVTFKNLTDTYGNVSATDVTANVTIAKDEAKPVVQTVSHKQDKTSKKSTFLVKLNEKVTVKTAAPSIKLVNKDGVLDTDTAAVTLVDSKGQALTGGATSSEYALVTLTKVLDNGSYEVTLPTNTFEDLATAKNVNEATAKTVVVTDGAEPTPAPAPVVNTVAHAANVLTVTFDKAVNTTAINPSNYKLNGKVLPAGTEITLDAAKKVATVTLPNGFVEKDITAPILTVSDIVATDNGKLSTVNVTVTGGPVKETVAPVLSKAVYTDAKEVTLTFSEATGIAVSSGKVEIYNGSVLVAKGDTTAETAVDGETEVVVTLTNEGSHDVELLNQSTLTVKIAKDQVTDTNGNKIAATSMSLADKATTTTGTLGATWNAVTKEFTATLATPKVEAGSTAYVYVAKDTAAAIDKDNYTNFTAVATQSSSNLAAPGLTFATTKDSYGSALANGDYKVYVVVKDTSGNVTVVTSTPATTVSGL